MGTARTVMLVSLILGSVVIGGLVAAEPGGTSNDRRADRGGPAVPQTNGTGTPTDAARNGSLGGQVSAFMQISAAGVEGAVDSGIWRASLNDTRNETERQRIINDRIEYLERWGEDIEAETGELRAQRNNNSSVSYIARASRLAARIEAYRSAVNQTAEVAAQENVSESATDELVNSSTNLSNQTRSLPAVDEQLPVGANQTESANDTEAFEANRSAAATDEPSTGTASPMGPDTAGPNGSTTVLPASGPNATATTATPAETGTTTATTTNTPTSAETETETTTTTETIETTETTATPNETETTTNVSTATTANTPTATTTATPTETETTATESPTATSTPNETEATTASETESETTEPDDSPNTSTALTTTASEPTNETITAPSTGS